KKRPTSAATAQHACTVAELEYRGNLRHYLQFGAFSHDNFTGRWDDFSSKTLDGGGIICIRMKPVIPYSSVKPARSSALWCGGPFSRGRPLVANCPEIFKSRRISDGSRPTEIAPSSICSFIVLRPATPPFTYCSEGSHPSAPRPVRFSIFGP